MFHKLRLKLTLVNASLMLILFALLIGGAYGLSQFDANAREEHIGERIIADIRAGRLQEVPPVFLPGGPEGPPPKGRFFAPPPPPNPRIFFVKVSAAGDILFQSNGQPFSQAQLAALVENVFNAKENKGMLAWGDGDYFYQKAPPKDGEAGILLFHDLSQAKHMQRTVMTALLVVGVICALLSFGASFFLANRAMLPIKNAWQQQKDFLSDVSHELRTPLAIIQTNLEIVRQKPCVTVAAQDKWLENIQTECVSMAKMVDSLLFLARSDAQQQQLLKTRFALHGLVLKTVAPFQALAFAKGVTLSVEAEEAVVGYGDEMQIRQAIIILIDNALRHTPSGGRVDVSLTRSGKRAVITVADSGEGIEAAYQEKIFDRFYQVDKARSNGGSAGLGLAIAKCISESHGGGIDVSSVAGNGASFTLWLPLEAAIH